MKKQKREFSKTLILQESVLIWITTIALVVLAYISIIKGYTGTLPWITGLISLPWAAYGVSQAYYYNKSKAENTSGGVKYESVLQNIRNQAQIIEEQSLYEINSDINIDYGI